MKSNRKDVSVTIRYIFVTGPHQYSVTVVIGIDNVLANKTVIVQKHSSMRFR